MKKQYIIILVLVLLSSCSHPQSKDQSDAANLSFEHVSTLPIGENSRMIEQKIGKSTNIYEDERTVKWLYAQDNYNKAVILINHSTGKIISKFWSVKDGEKERDLNYMLSYYPQAHFEKRDSKFIHPHKGKPTEVWFEDRSLGVFIEVSKASQVVEAIYWCAANVPLSTENCIKNQKDRSPK